MKLHIVTLVVVMILSTACAAVDIAPAQTANGLLRAVQNGPGTFMMASDRLIMIAWPQGNQYGFAVFTKDGSSVKQFAELASCTGNRAGCESMSSLVNHLKSIGWKRIFSLPAATAIQIKALADYFGTTVAATNFTLFVLPVGPGVEYQLNPEIDL